jgi:membrane-associated phospholipid phosphatase
MDEHIGMTVDSGETRRHRAVVAVAALCGLALLASRPVGEVLFPHGTSGFDWSVRGWMSAHRHAAVTTVAFLLTTAGGITGMRVLAVAGALDLWRRGQRRLAACVVAVTVVAFVVFTEMKKLHARPRPPALDGGIANDFAFPSGHATMSAAICCILAWLYWRAGLVRGRAALAVAILIPLVVGVSRVYLGMHWATDVLGGWSTGFLIAVVGAMAVESSPERS